MEKCPMFMYQFVKIHVHLAAYSREVLCCDKDTMP